MSSVLDTTLIVLILVTILVSTSRAHDKESEFDDLSFLHPKCCEDQETLEVTLGPILKCIPAPLNATWGNSSVKAIKRPGLGIPTCPNFRFKIVPLSGNGFPVVDGKVHLANSYYSYNYVELESYCAGSWYNDKKRMVIPSHFLLYCITDEMVDLNSMHLISFTGYISRTILFASVCFIHVIIWDRLTHTDWLLLIYFFTQAVFYGYYAFSRLMTYLRFFEKEYIPKNSSVLFIKVYIFWTLTATFLTAFLFLKVDMFMLFWKPGRFKQSRKPDKWRLWRTFILSVGFPHIEFWTVYFIISWMQFQNPTGALWNAILSLRVAQALLIVILTICTFIYIAMRRKEVVRARRYVLKESASIYTKLFATSEVPSTTYFFVNFIVSYSIGPVRFSIGRILASSFGALLNFLSGVFFFIMFGVNRRNIRLIKEKYFGGPPVDLRRGSVNMRGASLKLMGY